MNKNKINPKIGEYVANCGGNAYVSKVLSDTCVEVSILGTMTLTCNVARTQSLFRENGHSYHSSLISIK